MAVWKIAPGKRANNWGLCKDKGVIVIGWNNLGDCLQYETHEAIVKALKKKYGGGYGDGAGAARIIWRFVHDVQKEDVIVANKGESTIVGIGVVKGPYLHPDHPKNPVPVPGENEWWRRHARRVSWVVQDKDVDLGIKHFFVASTVQRLTPEQCKRIKQAYRREYPELSETLGKLFNGSSLDDSTLAEDLHEIAARNVDATTKAALTSARIGQGGFRVDVLRLWGNRCAVTGSETQKAIRASHIKPWRESTDKQRLDPYNGLPLVASLDALFDAGLISFDSSGKMLVSPKLSEAERCIFGIGGGSLRKKPPEKTAKYLAYHRAERFKKQKRQVSR